MIFMFDYGGKRKLTNYFKNVIINIKHFSINIIILIFYVLNTHVQVISWYL